MTTNTITSSRPYLIRALYEWMSDNGLTPHITVDVSDERVQVPREFVQEGKIVLNIAARAVGQFSWDNEWLAFSARFGGVSRHLSLPMGAIIAIHARENGAGMMFGEAEMSPQSTPKPNENAPVIVSTSENANADAGDDKPTPPKPGAKRPSLKVVK